MKKKSNLYSSLLSSLTAQAAVQGNLSVQEEEEEVGGRKSLCVSTCSNSFFFGTRRQEARS
jgi:hypothetical protein